MVLFVGLIMTKPLCRVTQTFFFLFSMLFQHVPSLDMNSLALLLMEAKQMML